MCHQGCRYENRMGECRWLGKGVPPDCPELDPEDEEEEIEDDKRGRAQRRDYDGD